MFIKNISFKPEGDDPLLTGISHYCADHTEINEVGLNLSYTLEGIHLFLFRICKYCNL